MWLLFVSYSSLFSSQYFTGNRDQNSVVQHRLFPRIKARYIRVCPWGWYRHISMRVEFYGCSAGIYLNLHLRNSFCASLNQGPIHVARAPSSACRVMRRSRGDGLVVSALDSGSSSPGTSPGWRHCVEFLANLMLGVTLRWSNISSRGE